MKNLFKITLFFFIIFVIYLGVLYFIQDDLLFYPDKQYKSPSDISMSQFLENPLKARDGTDIMTWYHEGDKDKPAILFLHGNGGQIATFAPPLRPILDAGYTVLMMEYRGFGNMPGTISQEVIAQDAALAFDWLKNNGYSKVIVYGYSFGTAFACALTAIRQIDGLILTDPFSSLSKIISEKPIPFAKLVLKDAYMSLDYLKKYNAPLLIIHGKSDALIPYQHAQELFDQALSKEKQIELLDNETHISVFFEQKNVPIILQFLKRF
ncbi:MAG: alpha/beta fold hydrolase [Alphaproteobacteria bacterium]|nr:alpha/beta fold hydrolase [Alphaproteobacteria bacterium]